MAELTNWGAALNEGNCNFSIKNSPSLHLSMHLEIKEICNKFSLSGTRDFSKIRVSSSRKQKKPICFKKLIYPFVLFLHYLFTRNISQGFYGEREIYSELLILKFSCPTFVLSCCWISLVSYFYTKTVGVIKIKRNLLVFKNLLKTIISTRLVSVSGGMN